VVTGEESLPQPKSATLDMASPKINTDFFMRSSFGHFNGVPSEL